MKAAHAPLDYDAPAVSLSVEVRTPTGASCATLALVFALGDGVGNAPLAQQLTTILEAVASVGDQVGGTLARSAR
jgi:hypothetical protein